TISLGEFSRLPWNFSAITVTVPFGSYRTTRRPPCSQESWRPSKSNVFPLLYPEGFLKTVTRPSSSIHLICTLFGISLHTRNRPTPFQAGPSAHKVPK